MKIVYCHNYYRHRGGEDISFESDLEMLQSEGHTVIPFTRDNQDLSGGTIGTAAKTLWNSQSYAEMLDLLRREKPDVMHCNNLFPQISTSVYRAATKTGTPIVQALRNYRTFCANSFFYRDGAPCTKCLNTVASWQGLRYRCYRDSLAATSVVVLMQLLNRILGVQRRYVDAFFTPTSFARQVHIDGGFSPDSIFVRTNFLIPDHGRATPADGIALYVGRLSDEKGVDTIIDAWNTYGLPIRLQIVGSGPTESKLHALARSNSFIDFTGQLNECNVQEAMANARFVIMSSRWYETFGRTMAEAFSRGTPVIASRLGAMIELVRDGTNGFLFDPGNSESLAETVNRFLEQGESAEAQMRSEARRTYEERFTPKHSYLQLLRIYRFVSKQPSLCKTLDQEIEKVASFLGIDAHSGGRTNACPKILSEDSRVEVQTHADS